MGISCNNKTVILFLLLLKKSGLLKNLNLKIATGISANAKFISFGGPPLKFILGVLGKINYNFYNPKYFKFSKTGTYLGKLLLFWKI